MTLADQPDTTLPTDYAALGATSLIAIAVLQLAFHLRNWRLPAKDSIVRIDSRAWDPNWSERRLREPGDASTIVAIDTFVSEEHCLSAGCAPFSRLSACLGRAAACA